LYWKLIRNHPNFESLPEKYRIAPKPRKVWVNEYSNGNTLYGYLTRAEADESADFTRIACHELELPPLP
jgi:hypothetical protein